jgi:hypothetical protein
MLDCSGDTLLISNVHENIEALKTHLIKQFEERFQNLVHVRCKHLAGSSAQNTTVDTNTAQIKSHSPEVNPTDFMLDSIEKSSGIVSIDESLKDGICVFVDNVIIVGGSIDQSSTKISRAIIRTACSIAI